jgi:hypothetical protein
LPNLLGFSVGAYSILVTVGAFSELKIIFKEHEQSYFVEVCTSFLHFVVIQVFCIILSIIYQSIGNIPIISHIAAFAIWTTFLYSILTTLSIAFYLWMMGRMIAIAKSK